MLQVIIFLFEDKVYKNTPWNYELSTYRLLNVSGMLVSRQNVNDGVLNGEFLLTLTRTAAPVLWSLGIEPAWTSLPLSLTLCHGTRPAPTA